MFHPRQRQQVAQLGGVEHVLCPHHHLRAVCRTQRHGADEVTLDLGGDRAVLEQDEELPPAAEGLQECFQRRQRHARLVAQRRHVAVARVQMHDIAHLGQHGIIAAVDRADLLAQALVAVCPAYGLNPRVLVRRHRLRSQLAANPIGLFGQDHLATQLERCQGGGYTAYPAAYDEDFRLHLAHIPLRYQNNVFEVEKYFSQIKTDKDFLHIEFTTNSPKNLPRIYADEMDDHG